MRKGHICGFAFNNFNIRPMRQALDRGAHAHDDSESRGKKGIAIEIQADSPYPRPKFLRLAKEMGAKFSFGTNNFDPTPKDLSRWLEAITWLDLKGEDIWSPKCLK